MNIKACTGNCPGAETPSRENIMVKNEILRSSFTIGGDRIFLEFDAQRGAYRLGTRWAWLVSFDNVRDACDAFEVLEFSELAAKAFAQACKVEIARVPRSSLGQYRNTMSRISQLCACVERRIAGLRPVSCGSKGAVVKWVAA